MADKIFLTLLFIICIACAKGFHKARRKPDVDGTITRLFWGVAALGVGIVTVAFIIFAIAIPAFSH